MLREIARVVVGARKRLKLDLDRLAERTSVARERLAALEAGRPGITTTEITRVAEELELDPTALMLGKEERRPTASIFLLHKGLQDFSFDAAAALDAALENGRGLRGLNAALRAAPSPRICSKKNLCQPRADAARHGYELANELRSRLGNKTDPLADIGAILEERIEIAVLVEPLPSGKMTAVSVRDPDGACAIVLSAKDEHRANNPVLDRVSLSHELCHLLYDESDGGLHIVMEAVDEGSSVAHIVERAEQRARGFAAELLMPLLGLNLLLGGPKQLQSEAEARQVVARVREHFGTPWEIAANHLNHHGYITDHARALVVHGPVPMPTASVSTRLPAVGRPSIALADRVQRAHTQGLITDGQARVALRIQSEDPLPWT